MSSKTIAVFTSQRILNTENNQKQILQALHDGGHLKVMDDNLLSESFVLELSQNTEPSTQNIEIFGCNLAYLSESVNDGDMLQLLEKYYLNFINFEKVVNFNIGVL